MLATPRLANTAVTDSCPRVLHLTQNHHHRQLHRHAAQQSRAHPLPAVVFEGGKLAEVVGPRIPFPGRTNASGAMYLGLKTPVLSEVFTEQGYPPTIYISTPGSYILAAAAQVTPGQHDWEHPIKVPADCEDLANVLAYLADPSAKPLKREEALTAVRAHPPTITAGAQQPGGREAAGAGTSAGGSGKALLSSAWSREVDGGATVAFTEADTINDTTRQVIVTLSPGDVYRLRLVFEATMPGLYGFGASTPADIDYITP